MSEGILGLVILALLGFIYFRERTFQTERDNFLTALMSKNSIEFTTSKSIGKPAKKEKDKPNEFVPEAQLTDDEFFEAIKKTVN